MSNFMMIIWQNYHLIIWRVSYPKCRCFYSVGVFGILFLFLYSHLLRFFHFTLPLVSFHTSYSSMYWVDCLYIKKTLIKNGFLFIHSILKRNKLLKEFSMSMQHVHQPTISISIGIIHQSVKQFSKYYYSYLNS